MGQAPLPTSYSHGRDVHPELKRGLAAATRSDRQWFADHPGEIVRLRPQFPEELVFRPGNNI